MKKVAILQSNYIPWKGYFDMIAAVIAFFVSLPAVVIKGVKFIEGRQFIRGIGLGCNSLVAPLLIACVLTGAGMRHAYNLIIFNEKYSSKNSQFISTLSEVRDRELVGVYLRPSAEALYLNPVRDCAARPFVYPAISERPWVGVVTKRADCVYLNYGYAQHGITPSKQDIALPPILLPDMTERTWIVTQ
jgi:hypothetical protein